MLEGVMLKNRVCVVELALLFSLDPDREVLDTADVIEPRAFVVHVDEE
jgi:hypothetical protein